MALPLGSGNSMASGSCETTRTRVWPVAKPPGPVHRKGDAFTCHTKFSRPASPNEKRPTGLATTSGAATIANTTPAMATLLPAPRRSPGHGQHGAEQQHSHRRDRELAEVSDAQD